MFDNDGCDGGNHTPMKKHREFGTSVDKRGDWFIIKIIEYYETGCADCDTITGRNGTQTIREAQIESEDLEWRGVTEPTTMEEDSEYLGVF